MDEIKWPSDKVRSTFIDYFTKKREHTFVPSSPTVPYDDPTLLFANSGMTQFKPIFLGTIDPKSPQAQWKRAANSQKCIRAGGKHNDLDDVGKDTYHHTYFEMLGNWSFSNYFQEEAIDWAWDLLVNVFELSPKRLYVTYFKGDDADGLPADEDAKRLWGKYLPPNRILPFGKKENFWEMGDTGPCGPCSEIHYDRRSDREDAAEWVNADSPEVIEIWNLVFMAFNREQSKKLTPLPFKHVDTGMGFERLTSILQDKPSNYDTDVFSPYFNKIQELTGAPGYTGRVGKDDESVQGEEGKDTAYRIVADHIRTLTFAITDGAVPSDKGRGYVLRRILRRAVRTGRRFLNAKDGFFHQLVDTVIEKCGDFFPELRKNPARVKNIIKREEETFQSTLNRGEAKFRKITKKSQPGDMLSGADTFLLYGSFGFPLDLIGIMAAEKSMTVDLPGFDKLLKQQAEDALKDQECGKQRVVFELKASALAEIKEQGVVSTVDSAKYLEDPILDGCTVRGIFKGDPEHGTWVPTVAVGETCGVVLDKTNFYAEMGGQIFDSGFLQSDGCSFLVREVKVYGGIIAHIGSLTSGEVKVGDSLSCSFNVERRRPIMANHTSTHLTNFALRKALKEPADQRGSVVNEDKFRFDFTAPEALTIDQIKNVELIVNELIAADLPVYTKEVSLEEAKKISGVRALFGEAYPDPCRVVSVGAPVDDLLADKENEKWNQFSIEFCGGTHLTKTSQAEDFIIVSEEAVRIGERRIVAVTGAAARDARESASILNTSFGCLLGLSNAETTTEDQLNTAYHKFVDVELKEAVVPAYVRLEIRKGLVSIEDKLRQLAKKRISENENKGKGLVQTVVAGLGDKCVVVEYIENSNNKVLSDTCGQIIKACQASLNRDVAVCLFTKDTKKKTLIMVANVPASLIAKGLKANEWTAGIATALGGKGGGSPKGDAAQGFCNAFDDVEGAIKTAAEWAQGKL